MDECTFIIKTLHLPKNITRNRNQTKANPFCCTYLRAVQKTKNRSAVYHHPQTNSKHFYINTTKMLYYTYHTTIWDNRAKPKNMPFFASAIDGTHMYEYVDTDLLW